MKKSKIIILVISLLLITLLAVCIIYKLNAKYDTHIYDKNGNEIATITYGDTSFFDKVKSYYLASALEEVLNDIISKENVSETEAEEIIAKGGYNIYLCVDQDIQSKLENLYADSTNFKDKQEASSVVLDKVTGEVIAIIGGRNINNKIVAFGEILEKGSNKLNKNIATEALLQPGEILSLISVYACGLENNTFTLDSIYSDSPISVGTWKPRNYYKDLKGNITIKDSIKEHSNIVKVKALQDIGLDTSFEFVKSLGISITENDKNYASISLGGMQRGCTLFEIATAYRTILNDGIYKEPIFYSKIVDRKNKTYLSNNQESKQIMNKTNSESLLSCIKTNIDGKELYLHSGTIINHTDDWCIINSDKYTLSTWLGHYPEIDNIESENNEAKKLSLKINDIL